MNPLLAQQPTQGPMPNNNQNGIFDRLGQFANAVNGDPRQIVEGLLRSGRMSQEQFRQYAQTANQLLGRR